MCCRTRPRRMSCARGCGGTDTMSDNLHRTRVIEDARAAHEWQVRRRRGHVARLAQLVDDPDFEATAALGDDAAAADWRYGVRLLRAKTARERLDLTLA